MEFVFVVPRRELFPDRYPQGFVPFGEAFSREHFAEVLERHGFFVERERAEREPRWKQVIPYSIVTANAEVLLLRRTARGGEARLHDKLSIGIGGHINPEDLARAGSRRAIAAAGALRELSEELVIQDPAPPRVLGILNDDSNPVGAVHVGLVQVVEVARAVAVRETDVLEGRLVGPDELRALLARGANFETWSALLVERLGELLTTNAKLNAASKTAPRSPDGLRPTAAARP